MSGNEPSQFSILTVAVIGAGTAGRSFALACVSAGFHVVLEDVMPANLRRAQDEFSSLTNAGAPRLDSETWEQQPPNPGSLSTALTVEDAVRNADLAIDFVPDELESKLEIFSMLDRMAPPHTILLTPSDAQSITDLASCTYRPDRCFAIRDGLSAGSPAHLVHSPHPNEAALAATAAFLHALDCVVEIECDPIAPMLVKNHPRT
ncbi:MAG TPA: 3-hydroxyacyl-CoA dehydrogenase NAD-binding domain-containing protein [Acidobacteriaceae bacterium]|nr:3-hydroxyacyl-CoA dehydrogenase NAD-binding domain-containing protein [Acidobacteriaceae bacterium]